ncbi:MAG: CoB--CoM heterodisulfide reductase iron-sulfur subunit A family protein [Candidatus Freyarchaeota archaeon]|nr:CoB--CoM heterodisulfide reductase iron-sulfur subunit A family protein [Candidatus Jordarchaeia archaeon]MBS7267651.1 CoB--CoM heterodisulfide reductase iron-sulfur subunit A family protein [Candidatus Jordarchaeia archaeon]MBS7278950.1 CoB--CoM heterodisulfide reductase iron-sulfur subunit A family protein [Candidatus Jordarchaeia archaeon]
MSEANLNREPRIGVFLCDCGANISGIIDIPQVIEASKGMPCVAFVERDNSLCSTAGTKKVREIIKKSSVDRVVFAGCSPKNYGSLFESVCQKAGINRYLVAFANIREQCAWAHQDRPKEATRKAINTVRMAVARLQKSEPLQELEIEVRPSTLIIGGGISGMTAALCLANQGFNVLIVEKEPNIGGMLNKLYKLYLTNQEVSEILNPVIQSVRKHKNIRILTSASVKEVEGYFGDFEVTVSFNGGTEKFRAGTIILATGAEAFEPFGMYGYGKHEGIVTQLELEQILKQGKLKHPEKVVMIQCVGAREEKGLTYCSRICCMVAIKNATLIKKLYPDCEVYIIYRDLQTYGKENEEYQSKARELGIKFMEYTPERRPEVVPNGNGRLGVKVYHALLGETLTIDSDLVILSTPLIPNMDVKEIAKILKVPLGSDGFFKEAYMEMRSTALGVNGIYVCGTAQGPKSIDESITQAYAAAALAATSMLHKKVNIPAITAEVNEDLCIGCQLCLDLCPVHAITFAEGKSMVIEAMCRGCGTCAAACPPKAIVMKDFKDEQILAEVEAALK